MQPKNESEKKLLTIDRNPHAASAYCDLANTLSNNESVSLMDGTTMAQQQLLLKAVELDTS